MQQYRGRRLNQYKDEGSKIKNTVLALRKGGVRQKNLAKLFLRLSFKIDNQPSIVLAQNRPSLTINSSKMS